MAALLIGMDYDATYTADPALWDEFITAARARGHDFVCVSGRREPPGSHERRIPMPIVCAGSDYKRHAAAKAGYHVNIWIDDMPEMIAPTKILDFGLAANPQA